MATYLYECPNCGEFEVEQRMSDPPLLACLDCGCIVRKLIAPTAIHAYTPVGAEADKVMERHHRNNRALAKGLVDGTMSPPDDRDVCGDKMSREGIRDFNEAYAAAKEGFRGA